MIDSATANLLEAIGLTALWNSKAPFHAAELQILRAVDCCLRHETACFGDMEDRVLQSLCEAVSEASLKMSADERAAFFPIWDQLDEATQLYVLNNYHDVPPMACGPKDCKMHDRARPVATHNPSSGIN